MLDCDTGGVYIFLSIGKFGPSTFLRKMVTDGCRMVVGWLVLPLLFFIFIFMGANHSVYWKVGMTFYQCDENLSDFFKIMILIVKCGVKYLACV